MTVFLNFFSLRKYFVWMLYLVNYCNGKLRGIGGRKSNFWGRHRCFYLPDCRTLGAAPALLPDTRRCQGFRVRAVGASGATRLSYISARHGGGAAARVDFCSPVFLELWGYSGRTRLFPQVNISVLGGGGQDDEQSGRLFSFSCLSLTRLFFPLSQQRRGEEYNLAASRERRGGRHRAPENSRYSRPRAVLPTFSAQTHVFPAPWGLETRVVKSEPPSRPALWSWRSVSQVRRSSFHFKPLCPWAQR